MKNDISSRLFIVDHRCVVSYGHNLRSAKVFFKDLSSNFKYSKILVPTALKEENKIIDACLYYPYEWSYLTGFTWLKKLFKNRISLRLVKSLIKVFYFLCYRFLGILFQKDVVLENTKRNWRKIIKKYSISSTDLIFFPSADYYGISSLLTILKEIQPPSCPEIHLRFIDVLEHSSINGAFGRSALFRLIKKAKSHGINISMSSEVPIYIDYLSTIFQENVFYLPYPALDEPLIKKTRAFTVSFIGEARGDKGYFDIASIIRALYSANKSLHFQVQPMSSESKEYKKSYERELEALPNTKILGVFLNDTDIEKSFKDSSILCLPYTDTYLFRGSAILQEALRYRKLVISSQTPGFSKLIARYGNGCLYYNKRELIEIVQKYYLMDEESKSFLLNNAYLLYEKDYKNAIKILLKSHL